MFPWITSLLSGILFPEGYIVLIGCVLIFAFLVEYCLDDTHPPTRDAKDMIFFTLLYGLIFWISGFGVVWYGVLIYFFMLSLIGLSALSFTTEDTEASPETKTMHILLSGSIVGFLCIYHIGGTLPHSWSNLRA